MFDLRLNQIPDDWHQIPMRFRQGHGIRGGHRERVFGSDIEEIDVLAVVRYGDTWLCCKQIYLRFILAGKAIQDWQQRQEMVPGIGDLLRPG